MLALAISEGWFRYRAHAKIADADLPIRSIISKRIWRIWSPTVTNTALGAFMLADKENVVMPPFSAFANRGEHDSERLTHIFPYAILPPSRRFTARDFLLPESKAVASTYHATSNAFGFRDPERSRQKPKGTYRIICLGAYTTFGHAVDDADTFPRQLERILNERYGPERRFEVWNGGIHASTAIMGLARVHTDVLGYAPDLVLLDYGIVDLSFSDHDYLAPGDYKLRAVPDYDGFYRGLGNKFWSRVIFPTLGGTLGDSYVVLKLFDKIEEYENEDSTENPAAAFTRVMRLIVETLRAGGVEVALMNSVSAPAFGFFERLQVRIGAPYFNVYQLIEKPREAELQSFDASDTWVSEFGEYRDRLSAFPQYALRPYMADMFQLNAMGQRRLAEGLARAISERFLTPNAQAR